MSLRAGSRIIKPLIALAPGVAFVALTVLVGIIRLVVEDEEGTLAAVKSDIAKAFGLIRHGIASDRKYYGDASEVVEINPLFGNAGRLVIKAKLFKSTIFLVCAALVLASCTTYKARLEARTEPRSAAVILPSPTEDWKLVEGKENITGWVRLRFDVSANGEVRDVQIIGSSDERLNEKAAAMLASWSFEPGTMEGKPTKFDDIEFLMAFFKDTNENAVVASVVIVAVLVALAVALARDVKRDCEFLRC